MKRIIILALAAALGALLLQCRTPAAPPPAPLGFIGDSITAGPTTAITGQILGLPVVNRGVSGTSTRDWLPGGHLFAAAVAAFRAAHVQVVQVALGTNDALLRHATPGAYHARLLAIAAALRSAGFRVILQPPPCAVPGSLRGYVTARSAALLAAYWGTGTGPWRYFRAHPGQLRDGIHPGPAGAAALARIWAAALHGYATP